MNTKKEKFVRVGQKAMLDEAETDYKIRCDISDLIDESKTKEEANDWLELDRLISELDQARNRVFMKIFEISMN